MKLIDIIRDQIPTGKFWTHSRTIIDGCTPISPGCSNCWLSGIYRRELPNMDGSGIINPKTGAFNGIVCERPDRLEGILPKGKRKPRVWTYWSDLFHPGVSREFRLNLFASIARSTSDYHIIITKRPEEAVSFLGRNGKFYPNVIIMVTMEDQERVQLRWKHACILENNGWRVGLLLEPLLGPIQIDPSWLDMMDWLITGGESGHNARPAHPDWFRSLRDQAQAAGVPFMFKQWGKYGLNWMNDMDGKKIPGSEWMDPTIKNPGRILDGRTWDEVPNL